MNRLFASSLVLTILLGGCSDGMQPDAAQERRISLDLYRDKVAGSWLGQIIGNTYGLSYEFKFLDTPGPDSFPYGFGPMADRLREHDGAFSDDDTDIEYMYLLLMEQHGIEPTYGQLTEAWKHHIRERIWAANRVALTLMRHGYYPPSTGRPDLNPRWFEIDPQLVNEIWAVTAPGLTEYAVAKSRWMANITSSGFGTEPTMHYAAMYTAAFFESDINRLIDIGTSHLPPGSRFARVVEEMKELYTTYPDDWQAARAILKERYYDDQPYNLHGWAPIDATLNGAAGILALLYGQGDVQHTLDMACAMGFDADNQAATMTGLLGLVHGASGLPDDLLYPVAGADWEQPFNDRYVNVTRYDLPDASLSDQIDRIVAQGKAVVSAKGGRIEAEAGADYLVIPRDAEFQPPFELNPAPRFLMTVGRPFSYRLYSGRDSSDVSWTLAGRLPTGLNLTDGRIEGTPSTAGSYEFAITAEHAGVERSQTFRARVRPPNLSSLADSVLHGDQRLAGLETLRDGILQDPVLYSRSSPRPETVFFGYRWASPITIESLGFHVGWPMEETGWFSSLEVEVLDDGGNWRTVSGLVIEPSFNSGNNHYLKPGFVEYDLRFDPVATSGVRLSGTSGGREDVAKPEYRAAISELTVH